MMDDELTYWQERGKREQAAECDEWRARADAAEAEVARLTAERRGYHDYWLIEKELAQLNIEYDGNDPLRRLVEEVAALRAQLAEEEWLPIGTFDGEFGEWWVWNGIEVARGYYGYEQWWDEWPGYDAARPLRAQPTHYCAVRQPAPPQE